MRSASVLPVKTAPSSCLARSCVALGSMSVLNRRRAAERLAGEAYTGVMFRDTTRALSAPSPGVRVTARRAPHAYSLIRAESARSMRWPRGACFLSTGLYRFAKTSSQVAPL